MYVFGDQTTNLKDCKPSSASSKSITIPIQEEEDSSNSFNEALLEAMEILLCLMSVRARLSKENALKLFYNLTNENKLVLGEFLLVELQRLTIADSKLLNV